MGIFIAVKANVVESFTMTNKVYCLCNTRERVKRHPAHVQHSLRKWTVQHKHLTLAQRTGTKFSKGSGARKASCPTPVSGGVFLNSCAGALSDAAPYEGEPSEEQVTKGQAKSWLYAHPPIAIDEKPTSAAASVCILRRVTAWIFTEARSPCVFGVRTARGLHTDTEVCETECTLEQSMLVTRNRVDQA